MNPDTNTLYLYVTDGAEDADEPKYVAGEVHINEKKHTITYHFDKDLSEKSIGTDSNLYKIFEKSDSLTRFPALNPQSVNARSVMDLRNSGSLISTSIIYKLH